MRILVVGAGEVGSAAVGILARRDFFAGCVVADRDLTRARRVVTAAGDPRFDAVALDAGTPAEVAGLCRTRRITHVLNAVEPRFVMPIFDGAYQAGADYLDMAMSPSRPHPTRAHTECGVKLGDDQFAVADAWRRAGRLALVGVGAGPGLSNVFARYAADHLFERITEIGVREVSGPTAAGYAGAPAVPVRTPVEGCRNPPVIYERGRGWFTTTPLSQPEPFDFPEGIGTVTCVNVEHEEVLLIPRVVPCGRVTFKYGLGDGFIDALRTVHPTGPGSTVRVRVGGGYPVRRDSVAAFLPDPATRGAGTRGRTCVGTWVRGTGPDGSDREVYLYHVVDDAWSMRGYGAPAVAWQAAVNPVIALELLQAGVWSGSGVRGADSFDAVPFLDRLAGYGSPWHIRERRPVRA